MPGLFGSLGSFGSRIISLVRETGRSIADAIGLAPKQARDLDTGTVIREFTQVAHIEEQQAAVAGWARNEVIPDYLHTAVDVPFNRPYAYTVTVSGRAVAGRIGPGGEKIGGRFTRDEFNITASRRLSPEEVEAIALRRFGAGGEYPLLSINRISVTAAMSRE